MFDCPGLLNPAYFFGPSQCPRKPTAISECAVALFGYWYHRLCILFADTQSTAAAEYSLRPSGFKGTLSAIWGQRARPRMGDTRIGNLFLYGASVALPVPDVFLESTNRTITLA